MECKKYTAVVPVYYLETSDFLVMRFLFLILQIYLTFWLQLIFWGKK